MTRRKDLQPDAVAETAPAEQAPTELAQPETVGTVAPGDEPVNEPAPNVDAVAVPPPSQRRSGIFGPLLGGALAAVGGFALSHFNLLGLAAPDISSDLATLSSQVEGAAAQHTASVEQTRGEISALADRIAALEAQPAPEAPDLSRLDALDDRLSAIEAMPADGTGTNAALTARVADLDRRLSALPEAGTSPDLQRQLDEALARLDAAEAATMTRAAEAEAVAASAKRRQALDDLSDAVTEGLPFASELQALDDPALTTSLTSMAETGVPTLAILQADFPEAARESLRVARDISTEDGWSDRLVDFLASQTGARSVTPRDGMTPDAILSRAEFALSEGQVADALTELGPLDPAVKTPLEAWIEAANSHVAATAALQAAWGE